MPERGRQLLLAAVVIALAVVMYRVWPRSAAAPRAAASVRGAAARRSTDSTAVKAPDVNIEALQAERPQPEAATRNLFRFRPPPSPPRPAQAPGDTTPPVSQSTAPPMPSVPPIPLKFIGVMNMPGQSKQIAILRDDRGVYYGPEGATIEGRYKILRIGEESIDMSYLDGRGRQTIRLTGS